MEQQIQQDPYNAFLTEIGTRLNEIEEKQRLIKDRILLVGENLISTKEEQNTENFQLKEKLKQQEQQIKELIQINKRIVYEFENIAKKSELQILQKQFKMFEPLEIARIKDVKKIVQEELKKSFVEKT